jgi:hypothetical protein
MTCGKMKMVGLGDGPYNFKALFQQTYGKTEKKHDVPFVPSLPSTFGHSFPISSTYEHLRSLLHLLTAVCILYFTCITLSI